MFKRLYISIQGRCSRRFYWIYGVIPFLVLGIIIAFLMQRFGLGSRLAYGILLFLLWPPLAMQAKRWHDIGQSGWMSLLSFIPFLGLIVCIVIGCIPGTVGDNPFGPDPLAGGPTPTSAL
jgi:uncharacterized membrane protein YhaH (DUF805 family)